MLGNRRSSLELKRLYYLKLWTFLNVRAPRRVELEDAFQQRLGAPMGMVFAACVADFFFKHGAKSCGFSGLAFGCVFRARFWARLIDVCSQRTHFWDQNTDSK